MAAPKRKAYSGTPPSGPGIFFSMSKITNHELLSDELFNKWYDEVHLRDVLATGAIVRAYRFRNANPDADRPYLAVYICPDLSVIAGDKVKNIPMTSDILPQSKSIHELADFDTRFYKLTQSFEKTKPDQEAFYPTLLVAGMEPTEGTADDLDAWYREEHLEQMSLEPGWQRTTRYDLVFQIKNENDSGNTENATSYLALYQFNDPNKLGINVEALDPMTDWTKKILQNTKKVESGIYHQIKSLP